MAMTEALLENRALWISAFPDDQTDATRASCDIANRQVARFCTRNTLSETFHAA